MINLLAMIASQRNYKTALNVAFGDSQDPSFQARPRVKYGAVRIQDFFLDFRFRGDDKPGPYKYLGSVWVHSKRFPAVGHLKVEQESESDSSGGSIWLSVKRLALCGLGGRKYK